MEYRQRVTRRTLRAVVTSVAVVALLGGCVQMGIPSLGERVSEDAPVIPGTQRPLPDETCTLRLRSHDATVTFTGRGSRDVCSGIQRIAGRWREVEEAPDGDHACSGSNGGIRWEVVDTGSQLYGTRLCDGLTQWSNGGTLEVP